MSKIAPFSLMNEGGSPNSVAVMMVFYARIYERLSL
jgi:hypothetical protein